MYLDNGATTHAFTAGRVEILRLIAGQAAISITNASLYDSPERKVADRTRELAAKTKKIAAKHGAVIARSSSSSGCRAT